MNGALFAIEQFRRNFPVLIHPFGDGAARIVEKAGGCAGGLHKQVGQFLRTKTHTELKFSRRWDRPRDELVIMELGDLSFR